MLLFLGDDAERQLRKLQVPHLQSPSRMELRCGWDIHQAPNDGLIFAHLIPKAK
jgi:hypothetical protein